MNIKVLHLRKFSDFTSLIEEECKKSSYSEKNELLLFRGQDVDMPLLPKLARELKIKKDFGIRHLERYNFHSIELMMLEEFKRRAMPFLNERE